MFEDCTCIKLEHKVSLTCQQCRLISTVTPNTQHVRCHGCQNALSVGNNHDAVCSNTSKESSQHQEEIKTQAKCICQSLRKKDRRKNSQYSQSGNPRVSIRTSIQPPRGKRAFLCGIAYKKQKFELRGTTQDVMNMRALLVEQFGFPSGSIFILAEESSYDPPTKENIEHGFDWLMRGIQSGDSLVFYFSGHGLRQRDTQGDEVDGFDETICPVDFQTNGMILDNYINQTIVRPLISGVKLHAIVDSCHSGTILDLPHVYDMNTGKWDDNRPPSGAYKGTNGGIAISFSACEDYQLAADTSDLSPGKEMTGAMTYTFIEAIKNAAMHNKKITYLQILQSMYESLKQGKTQGWFRDKIRRYFHRKIFQDPILSSSEEFNPSTEFKL